MKVIKMLELTKENWREVFEHSQQNISRIISPPDKPYSIAIFPQVYGNAVSKEEFYKEIAGIIIEEARMEYEFKEGDEHERTTRKQTKEEKRID
ncbi:hypothetical protein NSQ11_06085 [Bacillus sp. FSL W7-1582]|uniref:hypothetical protein n=1 Tax=Bacillus sp. FSL W7-1582 TaxID=2954566 RepID=UPI00315B2B04